jgi:hypothetical protein
MVVISIQQEQDNQLQRGMMRLAAQKRGMSAVSYVVTNIHPLPSKVKCKETNEKATPERDVA